MMQTSHQGKTIVSAWRDISRIEANVAIIIGFTKEIEGFSYRRGMWGNR